MIEIPFVVVAVLIAGNIFIWVNERHIANWVANVFLGALLVVALNNGVFLGVRHYKKTHTTPTQATVWFPDVPTKDIGESMARLAIVTDSKRAVTVICPKWFNPAPSRIYVADNFKLETGDGRFTPIVWTLRVAERTK